MSYGQVGVISCGPGAFPQETATPSGPTQSDAKTKRARYRRFEGWGGSAHPWSMESCPIPPPGTPGELTHHSWHKETNST